MAANKWTDRTGFICYDKDGKEILNTTKEFPQDPVGEPEPYDMPNRERVANMNKHAWMVRAGRGGERGQDFWDKGYVAIGFGSPDLSSCHKREDIERVVRDVHKDQREQKIAIVVGQCARFVLDFQLGDWVLTYHNERRLYYVGEVAGPYEHRPGIIEGLGNVRRVKWLHQIERDRLSAAARSPLGALMTIFRIEPSVLNELLAVASSSTREPLSPTNISNEERADETIIDVEELRLDSSEQARNFIVDRIVRLDWNDMQELVAGVLRAMEFKTRVSPAGSDRGCDILASPDGLGLSAPRILVEVKHRPGTQVDSQMLRSFLGARRPGDNGLYVSTGGFTKDARYEADRANIPLTLLDLDGLVDLLIQHYPSVDAKTRVLVPLVPVYWPVD